MVGEYLEESYKFDTNMLVEPIRKASHIRMIAFCRRIRKIN